MGYYINQVNGKSLPAKGKTAFLVKEASAETIPTPKEWQPNLVCVVDNGLFEAAGYAYSANEMEAFLYPDNRHKQWLLVPDAANHAK